MSSEISYSSVCVVDVSERSNIAIETISITAESCDLSGAWLVPISDKAKIEQIISGKKLLVIGRKKGQTNELILNFGKPLDIEEFLREAKADADRALKDFDDFVEKNKKQYAEYMAIKPAEGKSLPKVIKKNLTPPSFTKWPDSIDLEDATSEINKMGKLAEIQGTPKEMKQVLAASRLIQMLVQMWRSDELERVNRIYVEGDEAKVSILPNCWLED